MNKCYGLILAAGEGKRMKSKLPKVLHKVCGKAMVQHVIDAVKGAGVQQLAVVVGHKAEEVRAYLGDDIYTVYQKEQLGTGHAVMCAEDFLKDKEGTVIILAGDAPLITAETISRVLKYHEEGGYAATVLTADAEDPTGLGRIIRDANGNVEKIVEHKDASEEERKVKEVNSANYCFDIKVLLDMLGKLDNKNAQGEYYLTDTIELIRKSGRKVGAYKTSFTEFMAVNSKVQLYEADKAMRKRILYGLMDQGVTIIDPETVYIGTDVKVARDTVIYPGVILEGNTEIGEDCIIGQNTRIVNSTIENGVSIQSSVIMNSHIMDGAQIGPFAYIRPDSTIGRHTRIGDFVEIKKSSIGDGTKVSHLTYIGDATVGKDCNFGCGTVFVNYDGINKNKTIVGDHAFIGCNTNLIAPVEVGDNAYIAAGSTITDDVPEETLAIARARQVNKDGWVKRKNIWKK